MPSPLLQTNAVSLADKNEALQEFIMHHVGDPHDWALPFVHLELPSFLSVHRLVLVLGAVLVVLLFGVLYRKKDPVPRGFTNVLEILVLFIRDQIAIPSLGDADGRRLTPLLCTFFFLILCLNLMGMIPSFPAATGDISVTAALALVTLGFMVFGAIYRNGIGGFFMAFVPKGVPWPILFLIVPIEIMGLGFKTLALTIRLFANMLAGHIVIFSLLGMMYLFGLLALPMVFLAVGIGFLELFVCFLQAYIFTLLSALFMGQLYHPSH